MGTNSLLNLCVVSALLSVTFILRIILQFILHATRGHGYQVVIC